MDIKSVTMTGASRLFKTKGRPCNSKIPEQIFTANKTKTEMLQFITSTLRVIGVILETLNFCFLTFSNKLKSLIAHSRLTNKRV